MQPAKQQGTIQAFFKSAPGGKGKTGARRQASPAAQSGAAAGGATVAAPAAVSAAAAEQPAGMQQFTRKRKRAGSSTAAAAAAGDPATAAAAAPPATDGSPCETGAPAAADKDTAPEAQVAGLGKQQRQLTQLYLDVGQRHFHSFRCPTCGMLYARGTEADERLHAAFHGSATHGPRYQGWPGERVAQVDGSKGRVLLFCSADQGRGRKAVQELCFFLEEQMGLPRGWLLRVPLTLLLYVSAARRIQACVAAEGIREAYRLQPSLPPSVAQGMRSCGSAAVAPSSTATPLQQHSGSAAAAAADEQGTVAAMPAAAVACVATSGRSLLSVTLSSGAATATAECGGGTVGSASAAVAASVPSRQPAEQQQRQQQEASHPQQQDHQQQQQQQQAVPPAPPSPQSQAGQQAASTPAQQRQHQQQESCPPANEQEDQAAVAPAAAGGPGPAAVAGAAAPLPLPPLALDRSQRVRAVCGVRLMWVSLEARRRGLATRLLDCCRSQFMPGYVPPRHELAFSAPSEEGRAFIEAYTGTRRFLVYE